MSGKELPPLNWHERARFWSKVKVRHDDTCWPWRGCLDANGYGVINLSGRTVKAHRIAYFLVYGCSLDDLHIRHACDNPPCCNPYHLLTGLHADNMADCVRRGRHVFGSRVGSAKLTEEQALLILKTPGTAISISKLYGVSEAAVRAIRDGKTWKHLPRD